MALIDCPECGNKLSDKVNDCPHCGYPLNEQESLILNKELQKKVAKILIVVFLLISSVYVNKNILLGDDKKAYDHIVSVAYDFKNPSSVRITGGKLSEEGEYFWVTISATNSYGSRTSTGYVIGDFGIMESNVDSFTKDTTSLNIDKINRRLEKKLEV